jgi:DNA-binding Lrp family transcriptional regulator
LEEWTIRHGTPSFHHKKTGEPKRLLSGKREILIKSWSTVARPELASKTDLKLRILRELASPRTTFASYLRPTYSSVAKKLGVDEETIRLNVRQAQRDGTIVGWFSDINPNILGQETTTVILEVDDASKKDSLIKQIKLIPGALQIVDFYGRPLRIDFYHENDAEKERKMGLIKSICGDKNPIYWQRGFSSINGKLKKTDWQILKALRRDSMQNNAEIAEEVGVSPRTVKRRLTFLVEENVVYVRPVGEIKQFPGHVYFFLLNNINEKKKRELDGIVLSRLGKAVYADTRNKQYSIFSAVFKNMGEADETFRWIKSLDGAEDTKMFLEQQIIHVYHWIDEGINNRLAEIA